MTLPSLINKAEKFILAQQFKKNYANLQNAVNLAQAEWGMPYECYRGAGAYHSGECKLFWQNVLPKLKFIKVCDYNDVNCNPKYKTKAEVIAAGGQVDNLTCSLTDAINNHKVYTLYDGSYLMINNAQVSSLYSLWILIDVNGEKGPNKWGYDVFWTSMYRENEKKNVIVFDEICKMKEKGGVYFRDMILK